MNYNALATQNGYDLSTPFPFLIGGTFTELTTHVVTPRSSDLTGYKPGRNQENYSLSNEKGELLGFYSQQHQGIYTHKDSYIHVHFINNKRTVMGHVDKIAVAKSRLIVRFPYK
jgi:alpha-acetolactate decarboxylase